MEETKSQHLLQVSLDGEASHAIGIDSHRLNGLHIVDLRRRRVLHAQRTTLGEFPVNARNLDPVGASELVLELFRVLRLVGVVDFIVQHARSFIENRHPIALGAVVLRIDLLQPLGNDAQVFKVDVENFLQARALHLDDDLLARRLHLRAVDLTQGRRRERSVFEIVEERFNRTTELFVEDFLGELGRKRRHAVLQLFELSNELRAQHINTSRELLTNLDERRSKSKQPLAQPARQTLEPRDALLLGVSALVRPLHPNENPSEHERHDKAPNLERSSDRSY